MAKLTDHQINSFNRTYIEIETADDQSYSGAHHEYRIILKQTDQSQDIFTLEIVFQKGSVRDVGVNGITDEALLAILIHRLESWQKGPYNTRENAIARTHLETALLWLAKRSQNRLMRGVEGTQQV